MRVCILGCLNGRMFVSASNTVKRLRFLGLYAFMRDNRCRYLTICLLAVIAALFFLSLFVFLTASVPPDFDALSTIPGVPVPPTSAAVRPFDNSPLTNWAAYQYAIFLDCGSSGSRIFIYYWPEHSGVRGQLLDIRQLHMANGMPAVMKVEPGLSAFPSDPSKATDQVVKLLMFAKEHIPVQCHQDTFIYIMATAGMRVLKEIDQQNILSHIRVNVPLRTPFRLPPDNVEVITGKWEGIYAWIAINAALGRLGNTPDRIRVPDSTPEPGSSDTVGIIDMGGGSIQIAFELDRKDSPPPDVMATFSLGTSDAESSLNFRLYVATYLGLGANSALRAHIEALAEKRYNLLVKDSKLSTETAPVTKQGETSSSLTHTKLTDAIVDPCHPSGYNAVLNLTLASNDNAPQPVILNGSGEFSSCKNRLQYLLASLSSSSSAMPLCGLFCSPLAGIPAPIAMASKPPSTLKQKMFYGFSEFWYSMEDCLHLGGRYNHDRFDHEAGTFCSHEWQELVRDYTQPQYSAADYARFTTQCFKSAWLSVILHSGFLFDIDTTNFASVQKINGSEVHWGLGALLYKTRTLPLRRIQLLESVGTMRHGAGGKLSVTSGGDTGFFSTHFIPNLPQVTILVCGGIVIFAIVFYCHKLRTSGSSRRPTTGSVYDQAEMGLLTDEEVDTFSTSKVGGGGGGGGRSRINESTQTAAFNQGMGRKGKTSFSVGSRMHHMA